MSHLFDNQDQDEIKIQDKIKILNQSLNLTTNLHVSGLKVALCKRHSVFVACCILDTSYE